jgi:hypothetical protein
MPLSERWLQFANSLYTGTNLLNQGNYQYLQIVENRKEKGKVKQRGFTTFGRMDVSVSHLMPYFLILS